MSRPPAELSLQTFIHTTYERLVAVEVNDDGSASLFARTGADEIIVETVPFEPWLLVASAELAATLPATRTVKLAGSGAFACRVHFDSAAQCTEAARTLKNETGCNASSMYAPYRVFGDLQQQLLTSLPARLFRTMEFSELRRLQLDIETLTSPGFDFPNAEREGDAISMIALRDSTGWETCLLLEDGNEKRLLDQMVQCILERDPDVIEGHNIFDFDLPYIEQRSRMCKVKLKLGRRGRTLQSKPSRFSHGERTAAYRRYTAWGRHIVDTLHLVQLYDVSHRDLESYSLKAVARHFGVAAPDRTYVEGAEISSLYASDPSRLRAYALDDVRETEAIARILSPSYFYQAQVVPFSYQNCVTRGSAARIDAMLVADYMQAETALPRPSPARPFSGGLTESFASGIFHNVWHIDVQSLYPSIIVSRRINPQTDTRGAFNAMLEKLRTFRLGAKKRMQQADGDRERDHYNALQSSFKILINSFYGYLGFAMATFNDFNQAEAVTAEGRRILSSMVDFLRNSGAMVIEIDTDGIYFVPPPGAADPQAYTARVQEILPPGIDVELDAVYVSMFSYKAKNYALMAQDGTISVTGAAMKSRGLEPFQRKFIRQLVELILSGKGESVTSIKNKLIDDIRRHRLPLAELAKRETLSSPPKSYQEKLAAGKTRRSAAYELVANADREYKQGDLVAFYVTGDKKNVSVTEAARLLADAGPGVRDENVPYYIDKVEKLHAKFADFIPSPDDASDLPLFSTPAGK